MSQGRLLGNRARKEDCDQPMGASIASEVEKERPLNAVIVAMQEMEARVVGLTNRLSGVISRLVGCNQPVALTDEPAPPADGQYAALKLSTYGLNEAIDFLQAQVNRAESEL